VIAFCISGVITRSLMGCQTGAIVNIVKKSERPRITWFGGSVAEPIACLKKLRTTRILVNEVIISRIAGATERTVKIDTILIAGTTAVGSSVSERLMLSAGIPVSAYAELALKMEATTGASIAMRIISFRMF
jgi:hypothetical protein